MADADHEVAKAFGVLMPNRPNAQRETFVIDKQGTVRKVYPKVSDVRKHPAEVLDYVKEHLADKK